MVRRQMFGPVAAVLLLAAAWTPIKYTNSILACLPGFGILSVIFLSIAALILMRQGIRFEAGVTRTICERGEDIELVLKIRNRSLLSSPNAHVVLEIPEHFGGAEAAAADLNFPLYANSEEELPVKIRMKHIGVFDIGVRTVRIYDPLKLFSIALKGSGGYQITVLPQEISTEEINLRERLLTESRTAAKNAVSDGSDYTGVREYALGDPMKRIHWKLSAHSHGYMTKISESSRKNDLAILIDLKPGHEKSGFAAFPEIYDCLIETALSLAEQALKKDSEYSMLFLGKRNEPVRVAPKGEADREALVQLLPATNFNGSPEMPDGTDLMEEEGGFGNKSANLILCTANLTDRIVRQLNAILQQQRSPELFFVVPHDFDVDQDDERMRLLEMLDENGIVCHVISAEKHNGEIVLI